LGIQGIQGLDRGYVGVVNWVCRGYVGGRRGV